MRHFTIREVGAAQDYADAGGQALHAHNIIVDRDRAPSCFVRDVDAGRDIAHLFDRDPARLVATVRSLGVRVVAVERRGRRGQHVDLCGGPLKKALGICAAEARGGEPWPDERTRDYWSYLAGFGENRGARAAMRTAARSGDWGEVARVAAGSMAGHAGRPVADVEAALDGVDWARIARELAAAGPD